MGHVCPAWVFWVTQLQGGIPKALGQICSLSERGTKPAPSWADNICIEVVNRKPTFPSSGWFLPLRREHEVRDISQDPDISCLLFPSCSSGWCQYPCIACFAVMFSNCVLGKLVRHDQPWGPTPLCTGISQEDLAEGNLSCTPCVAQLLVHAVLKKAVVPSVVGTDGWGGCPGRPSSLQSLGTTRRSRAQAAPSAFGVGTQCPRVGCERSRTGGPTSEDAVAEGRAELEAYLFLCC